MNKNLEDLSKKIYWLLHLILLAYIKTKPNGCVAVIIELMNIATWLIWAILVGKVCKQTSKYAIIVR